MKKKKNVVHILVIVFAIACFIIFASVLGYYIYLKTSLSKEATDDDTPVLDGALLDMQEGISDIYGFYFAGVLSGENMRAMLPEWVFTLTGDTDTLYVYGSVYGSGAELEISTESLEDEDESPDEAGVLLEVIMDQTGIYLTNPDELKYRHLEEAAYENYEGIIGGNAVYLGDGDTGRDILNSLVSSTTLIGSMDGVKTGVTEDGYDAFSFSSSVSLNEGFITDNLFNLPADFSAYEIPSESDMKGFELYGYGENLEVSLVLVENQEYQTGDIPENYISYEELSSALGF